MDTVMSEEALTETLNHFKDVVRNYDFSEVSNVIFFDLESLYCYLKAFENNPFERQYEEMESILDKIIPYLPSTLSCDTIEVLNNLLNSENTNSQLLKEHILFNMKLDFIERVKNIKSDTEWQHLVKLCNEIRSEKEHDLQYER